MCKQCKCKAKKQPDLKSTNDSFIVIPMHVITFLECGERSTTSSPYQTLSLYVLIFISHGSLTDHPGSPFCNMVCPLQLKDYQVLALYRPTHLEIYDCTCLESPLHPLTMRAAHCRHNVVVGGVSSEPLRECDGCHSTLGGGGVPVDQVGVGWVCTIVNGAGVPWLI